MKAILLDVDNTLLDFDACALWSMREAAKEMNIELPEHIFSVFQPINNSLWRSMECGEITVETLYRVRWNRIFDAVGIKADGICFEKLFAADLAASAIPVEGALDLVRELATRYILCAASNGPYEQQRVRLEKAEMLASFSHLFISEDIGCSKPSKEFFAYCLQALAPIPPEEILMIGDSLTADIAGARQCGIRTCWYVPKAELPESGQADYVVRTLDEVLRYF